MCGSVEVGMGREKGSGQNIEISRPFSDQKLLMKTNFRDSIHKWKVVMKMEDSII